jgi:hypothetical protein
MLASYIRPPLATVNVAMPWWYAPTVVASFLPALAPADEPVVAAFAPAPAVMATTEASAPKAKLPLVKSLSALVLEKDYLGVGLATELQAYGHLRHRRIAVVLAFFVHLALSKSTAHAALPIVGNTAYP